MKIVRKKNSKDTLSRIIWLLIALLLLVLVLFNLFWTRSSLPASWKQFVSSIGMNGDESDLPALVIDMAYPEYDRILGQRSDMMTSGVVLLGDQDFVPADITFENETIPVRMRLQQGLAEHLEDGEKWNYEVRTRNDQLLKGMQRFYLIDPADNNWLNEALFATALSQEGLMAGRYDFVRLYLNGDYHGIYAVQEGFGPELIGNNDMPAGVVVEFDSEPYYESIAYYGGRDYAVAADPVTNMGVADFQFFEVDTFRDAAIAEDPELSAQKDKAIGLLRGFQSGDLTASEVFDVEKYGRFLALVDLWSATEATYLINLRIYFNPETGLLEPIAFNANPFGSSDRLSMSAAFGDATIQSAYLDAAQRMAEPAYLDGFIESVPEEAGSISLALESEAEQSMPWEQLRQRQADMIRSLQPLQPVFAYLGSPTLAQEGIIQVDVGNVLNLPVEIIGFDIDGATFLEVDPAWIQSGEDGLLQNEKEKLILAGHGFEGIPAVQYVRFHIPLTEILQRDDELDFLHDMDLQLATRIVGLEDVQMTSARPGYPDPIDEGVDTGASQ